MSKTKLYWLIRKDGRGEIRGPFTKKRAFLMLDLLIGEWFVTRVING